MTAVPDSLAAFALTSLLIELTPGPNMAYLAMLSAVYGRRAGFAATAGVAAGLLALGLLTALGLSELISNSHLAYEILRWGGVLYLLWLAYEGWRETAGIEAGRVPDAATEHSFFTRGLMTNVLNPKAALFYAAVLPTFVDAARPALPQTMVLLLVYVAIASAVHGTLVALAGSARHFLHDPVRLKLTRRGLSAGLAAIALWLAYATAH